VVALPHTPPGFTNAQKVQNSLPVSRLGRVEFWRNGRFRVSLAIRPFVLARPSKMFPESFAVPKCGSQPYMNCVEPSEL